jgi:hypothetical protein
MSAVAWRACPEQAPPPRLAHGETSKPIVISTIRFRPELANASGDARLLT